MVINTETAIAWMSARAGKVTYSMTYRNGPSSFDCSSAVYFALRSAGASDNGWAVNTEAQHDWLIKNGYTKIADGHGADARRGDIFIWGKRGFSAGSGGHTGIFVDANNIIHCNYGYNGITINNHDVIWSANGQPYFYLYRYTGKTATTASASNQIAQAKSQFEKELDVNARLAKSNMPYYEATMSIDYYVETFHGKEKELLKAGSRVRVYEKMNGYARIGAPQSDQWVEDRYLVDATDL